MKKLLDAIEHKEETSESGDSFIIDTHLNLYVRNIISKYAIHSDESFDLHRDLVKRLNLKAIYNHLYGDLLQRLYGILRDVEHLTPDYRDFYENKSIIQEKISDIIDELEDLNET